MERESVKWRMPGWRIEQKFSSNTLIGNWLEERQKFDRETHKHNSTHRSDFVHFKGAEPDHTIRRRGLKQNDGMGHKFLFNHHGNAYDNYYITMYDEIYNRRERKPPNMQFPDQRSWNGDKLAWVPEKTDYPLKGEPTNWGLWQSMQPRNERKAYDTIYSSDFLHPGTENLSVNRLAIPRKQSTLMNPVNDTKLALNLRGSCVLTQPEIDPHKMPKLERKSTSSLPPISA